MAELEEYEVGEVILARAKALSKFSRHNTVVSGLTGSVEVFSPSKDPINVPNDRANPDVSADFAYVSGVGYVAHLDTTGLSPAGEWTLRGQLRDEVNNEYDSVEYTKFTLRE